MVDVVGRWCALVVETDGRWKTRMEGERGIPMIFPPKIEQIRYLSPCAWEFLIIYCKGLTHKPPKITCELFPWVLP